MTREEAIKYLIKPTITSTFIGEEKQKELNAYNMAIEALKQKPMTGHWIMDRQRETRQCDKCMTVFRWSFNPHNYCPNCGAEMKEGDA